MATQQIKSPVDITKPFVFLGVEDYGDACCPHCGADGRYIYTWAEFGEVKAAMAGCFSILTGKIKKDSVQNHIERIAVKQAKGKTLNGWDKTILRMLDYQKSNASDAGKCAWAENKIKEAVSDCIRYAAKNFRS